MEKSIEETGKAPEDAIEAALQKLGVSKDEVNVEVLENGSRGLFGILGAKKARVRVEVKESKGKKARDFAEKLLQLMRAEAKVEVIEEEDYISVEILGNNLGFLIGYQGKTIDALQYLTYLAANQNSDYRLKVTLDVGGYKKRHEQSLQELALRLADKVKETGRESVMRSMNSAERRIIHITLQDDPKVITRSYGEEPRRHVVISPVEIKG